MVTALIAYSNTFSVPFQWDDIPQILMNENLQDLSSFNNAPSWMDVNQRPLSKYTLALNWQYGGEDVRSYHIVNLLFHILTALLVYFLTTYSIALLSRDEKIDQRMKQPVALFVTLLFLLHPLQTMAVTYITQRMTVMAALFYVLSVYMYARGRVAYVHENKTRNSIIFLSLAVISGILGLMSKQNAVTFPAAFLLYELFFIRRPDGKICRKYLLSAGTLLVVAFFIVLFGGYLPAETDRFTRSGYFITQLGVIHKYLLLLILPINQSADYFIAGHTFIGVYEILGIILVGLFLFLGVYLFRKNKLISFGIFFFFLSASVESGLIPIKDVMMEHRMYLPMLGFVFVLAGLILKYFPYKRLTLQYFLGGLVLVILTIATFNRNKVWQSEVSLWQDCLDKNPTSARAMNNLGFAIKGNAMKIKDPATRTRELNLAITYFTSAMGGDTIFTDAFLNRGHAYIELGKYNKALSDIERIANQRPKERYLKHYLEGVVYARKGEMQPALQSLNEAIRLNQEFALLFTWRGLVHESLEDHRNAIADFKRSLELDASQTLLMINLSNAHFALEEMAQALYWAQQARNAGEVVDPQYIKDLESKINR